MFNSMMCDMHNIAIRDLHNGQSHTSNIDNCNHP